VERESLRVVFEVSLGFGDGKDNRVGVDVNLMARSGRVGRARPVWLRS